MQTLKRLRAESFVLPFMIQLVFKILSLHSDIQHGDRKDWYGIDNVS